jgi:hypothetical protein
MKKIDTTPAELIVATDQKFLEKFMRGNTFWTPVYKKWDDVYPRPYRITTGQEGEE